MRNRDPGPAHWLAKLLDDQSIRYTDAVSFAVMEETRCPAVMSFDRDFALAGFTLWGASE